MSDQPQEEQKPILKTETMKDWSPEQIAQMQKMVTCSIITFCHIANATNDIRLAPAHKKEGVAAHAYLGLLDQFKSTFPSAREMEHDLTAIAEFLGFEVEVFTMPRNPGKPN